MVKCPLLRIAMSFLITIEGGEGAGKSSQMRLLAAALKEIPNFRRVVTTLEPGGTPIGEEIRAIVNDDHFPIDPKTDLFLYAADRAAHVSQVLRPALEAGKVVLCDRYSDSALAYQGYGWGLDLAQVVSVDRLATGGLEPDLTIWLDINPSLGLERARGRGALDRMERLDIDFHTRVRWGFYHIAVENPDRVFQVDASQSIGMVARQVLDRVKTLF